MAGDVVSVKTVEGKVVLKPYRFMVFEGMVTEYQSSSSRFIFARLVTNYSFDSQISRHCF